MSSIVKGSNLPMVGFTVRPECPEDFSEIRALVALAFQGEPHAEGDEQDFIERQRSRETYLPDLALVACAGTCLVGHIMLSRHALAAGNGLHPILLLACVAVAREHRGRGIGRALIQAALRRAEDLGHGAIALVGERALYGRFGFDSASRFNLVNENGFEPENVLVRELTLGTLHGVAGTIRFPT